jgi:acetylornithine/succinyldiaminopimelate/putrescine aminotransferase
MAKIIVRLFVEATDLTVEEMTDQVGLSCNKSWRKGDRRGKTGKTFPTNSWALESRSEVPEEEPLTVAEVMRERLNDILQRIHNHADRFRLIASGRTSGLLIGITAEAIPPLAISAATIRKISRLGVDLEIDLVGA